AVTPDVTAVIVSWNTREHLARCLSARDGAADGRRVETMVVDNSSSDGSQAMGAAKFGRARRIQSAANASSVRASNAGGRAATAHDLACGGAACALVRRKPFETVDGFDERFFMYMEDVDLCARLGEAGFRLRYLPDAVAVHHWGASTVKSPGLMLRHAYLS